MRNWRRAEAIKWYRKAAERGYEPAQTSLGACYVYGLCGITKNYEEARKWFYRAIENGDETAKYYLKHLPYNQ